MRNSECYICRNSESSEKLIRPCSCRGTIGSIHQSCLKLLNYKQCPICKIKFFKKFKIITLIKFIILLFLKNYIIYCTFILFSLYFTIFMSIFILFIWIIEFERTLFDNISYSDNYEDNNITIESTIYNIIILFIFLDSVPIVIPINITTKYFSHKISINH